MNIKSNTVATDVQQSSYSDLSHIEIYNNRVKENLAKNPLSLIQKVAIKHFKDQHKQSSIAQYNKAVAIFNKSGEILKKKKEQQHYNSQSTEYEYLNYALLDEGSFSKTMDNFHASRKEYNTEAKLQNEEIREYNSSVVKDLSDLTKDEKRLKREFKAKNNKLTVENYNDCVDFENESNPIHLKRTLKPVRNGFSQLVFTTCLFFYGAQLRVFNANQMNTKNSTKVFKNALPKISISPNDIVRYKQNGIRVFDDNQEETVAKHLKRFIEAGFITDYKTTNHLQRARWRFSRKILVLSEGKLPNRQKTENQKVNSLKGVKQKDSNQTTRTLKEEKEKKDNSKRIGFQKCGSMLQSLSQSKTIFYKNTTEDENSEKTKIDKKEIAPEILNKNAQLSENARELILTSTQLANLMTDKVFNDTKKYKPLSYALIHKILMYSSLEPGEISELLAQDFIKSNWKLYKNHPVVFWEWKRAITRIKKDWFDSRISKIMEKYRDFGLEKEEILTTGTAYKGAEEILALIKEYREKLEIARKRWLKMSFNCNYPFKYYDVKRTETYHLAFFGVHKIWKQKKIEQGLLKMEDKKEARKIRTQRKQTSSKIKMEKALVKYYTGKYTRKQLFKYVQNNLEHKYLQELQKTIISNNVAIT